MDAFEVSATDESVLSSNGLLRRFPGVSVAIPANKLADERFCSSIASSVAQLASEAVTDMLPKSRKAGTDMVEVRDTTHPGLVTEGLMTQLLAVGCQNKSTKVVKCVRDEVNWHSALLPWRRSPAWLVFRVALQIILQRCFPDSEGHIQYKNFVLFLMAMLADLITKKNQQETSNQNIERWAIIRARLGQRIFKLKKDVFPFVANRVNSTDKYLLDKTLSAQEEIREANRVVIPHVPSSASQEELHMSLVHCKSYLHAAMNPSHVEVKPTVFDPPHFPSLQLDDGLPVLSCVSVTAVCAFEEWIDHNLQAWYTNLATSIYEKICGRVEILMKQYWLFAQQIYDSNPPVISVAVLVMLELWVVLDRMAVHICPLLKEYSPEIPKNFLQPLLLPKFSQMKRARKIEQYLSARYDESESSYPSIFCDPAPYCFGVQYFDSSLEHQILERNIQTHAEKARVAKRMEWERLSALHENLCDEMRRSSHLWDYDSRGQYVHFNYRCRLCSLEREAESMRIQLHEWPLPDKDIARKCAVFELNLPIWFAPWRNMTWYTVQELGQRRTTGANGLEKAWLNYAGVAEFAVDRNSDIILSSDKKSWSQTHYNGHGFPVSFETICVRNGLHLRLFDNIKNAWVMEQTEKPSVKAMCTMKLPPGRYSSLQFAISSTTHTQNEVMAAQKHCHRNLSLREFESFGCLRSGENIQWYNILRELASAALSFNEEAVGSLIRQAAWEMGRAISDFDSTERAANVAFKDIEFAGRLLQMLKERLTQIEKNWHEHRTLDIIVALVCRIAALSSEPCLIEKVFNFLRQCRNVAMDWCNDLNENVVDHEEGPKFRQNVILQIASTCQATFDVDASQVTASLSSSEDLCSFIRCSIFLFENRPSAISRLPDNIRFKVENSERTRFLFRVHTRKMIMEHPLGLSEALQRTISCLEVSGAWKICEEADSWVTSRTEGRLNAVSQQLHYNYLTGEFLVDGNTPGRLPANYMSHPLYQRLFGVVSWSKLSLVTTSEERES